MKCVKCGFKEERDNIPLHWAIKHLTTLKGKASNQHQAHDTLLNKNTSTPKRDETLHIFMIVMLMVGEDCTYLGVIDGNYIINV